MNDQSEREETMLSTATGPLVCECGATFASRDSWSRHKRTACPFVPKVERALRADNRKRRPCPTCGADLLARDVKGHIARKHTAQSVPSSVTP